MDNSLDIDGNLNRSLTNSQIYDGEFFEIVGSEGEILVVRCNICTPDGNDGQLLRTSVKSNGNILKHIKRRHSELLEKIKVAKSVKSRAPRSMKRGQMMSMEDEKPFKKKTLQIKVKKQHEDELLEDCETVFITTEDGDSIQTNQDVYLIDGVTESDGDEYVDFEVDGNKCDDRVGSSGGGDMSGGVGSIDEIHEENSLLTAPEFDYVGHRSSKPAVKRLRESTVTPHEFTTSTTYKRVSSGGSGGGGSADRSLIEFQKKLMQAEYDHMKKLRDEKHQLEIAILKADLTHKTLEHQKQMELLNRKLED